MVIQLREFNQKKKKKKKKNYMEKVEDFQTMYLKLVYSLVSASVVL